MDAGAIRAGKAYVEVGSDESKLVKGLNSAAQRLQKFGSAVRGIGLQVAGAGSAIFAPLAAAGQRFAEHGENIEKGSKQTGLSAQSFSTLGYAANQTGVDSDALTTSFGKMSRTLIEASQGSKEAQQSLLDLGLSVSQLNKLSQEDRFKAIAQSISQIEDPAARAAAAIKIFGKSGAELLPLLLEGSSGITALQQHAKSLGLEWSGPEAEAASKFERTLRDLWDVLARGVDVIGSAVAPVMEKLASTVIMNAQAAKIWVQANQGLIATVAGLGVALIAAGTAVVVLGTAIDSLGIILGTFASITGIAVTVLTSIISPLGIIVAVSAAAVAALLNFTSAGAKLSSGLKSLGTDAKEAFDGIKGAMSSGDFATAARVLWDSIKLEWDKGVLYIETAVSDLLKPFVGVVGLMERAWSTMTNFATTAWHSFTDFVATAWNNLNLGPIFLKVWELFKSGLQVGIDAAVVGFSAIEAIVTNWRDSLGLAWAAIELGAVKSVNEISYLFTEVLPTAFGWLVANGPKIVAGVCLKIFDEVGNLIKTIWDYVKDVAPKIGAALWNALKGTGKAILDFDAKAFEAFRSGFHQDVQTTGGPQIQPRVESQTEKDLEVKAGGKTTTVEDEIKAAVERNQKALDGFAASVKKAVTPTAADTKAGTTALPDVAAAKKELDASQKALDALTRKAETPPPGTNVPTAAANGGPVFGPQRPDPNAPVTVVPLPPAATGPAPIQGPPLPQSFASSKPRTDIHIPALGAFQLGSANMAKQIFGQSQDIPNQQLTVLKQMNSHLNKMKDKVGPVKYT